MIFINYHFGRSHSKLLWGLVDNLAGYLGFLCLSLLHLRLSFLSLKLVNTGSCKLAPNLKARPASTCPLLVSATCR